MNMELTAPVKIEIPGIGTIESADLYLKSEADKEIAEKDKEIAELKKKLMPCLNGDCILTCEVVEKYGKENAELKAEIESLKASHYAEMVDAGMRERRLRRALWLARARSAHNAAMMWNILSDEYLTGAQFTIDFKCLGDPDVTEFQMFRGCMDWMEIYENVERKCRAKAEEYK